MRRWAPRQKASRAAWYCRSLKISVTLSVTPGATSSSSAARPAGVAGTLIMRFLCPADHCLPSSMYRAAFAAIGSVFGRVFQQRVEFEADVAVVAAGAVPDRLERRLGPGARASRSVARRSLRRRALRRSGTVRSVSKRPVLIRSEMMIGLDVAPVAPRARFAVDLVGIDGIEPELGAAGDQRLQRRHCCFRTEDVSNLSLGGEWVFRQHAATSSRASANAVRAG